MLPDSNYNTDQLRIQPVCPSEMHAAALKNIYIIALDKFIFFAIMIIESCSQYGKERMISANKDLL